MGFDAHMLDATSDTAKKHIGWVAYVLGASTHLMDRPMGDHRYRRRRADAPARPVVLIANVGRL
jgi:hypothetical protein